METLTKEMQTEIKCPTCDSDALYRYGHTSRKKQRYLCLICGRQFSLNSERQEVKFKPFCSSCGKPMHLYMREELFIRFRCSGYPECKTYSKIMIGGEL